MPPAFGADRPADALYFRLEGPAEIGACLEIVPEYIEQRIPTGRVDMAGAGHDNAPPRMHAHHLGLDDLEGLGPVFGPGPAGIVPADDFRLELDRALGDPERPDQVGRLRSEARDIEFGWLECVADF